MRKCIYFAIETYIRVTKLYSILDIGICVIIDMYFHKIPRDAWVIFHKIPIVLEYIIHKIPKNTSIM